jgi:microcystin degradation protein MlrC
MPRVGILALIQESNTFLSRKTTFEDFQNDVLIHGEEIRKRFEGAPHELGGFFEGLQGKDVEVVPIFAARAYPFGNIIAADFLKLVGMLIDALKKAGPLDGLLVAPHGATVSEAAPDADGYWLNEVRKVVGPKLPIIGTLDPHVNLSPLMVASVNAFTSYRTNPHIDQKQRGLEAVDLLLRILKGEIKPTQAACFPPTAINIERQCTDEAPLTKLVEKVAAVRKLPKVLSSSLMLSFPYADVVEFGSATLVVTDNDPALAQKLADELGQELWSMRKELAGSFLTVPESVTQAAKAAHPACLLDMGDNVGGGSPADGTLIAQELLKQNVLPSFVCLYDPEAVQKADQAGIGKKIKLSMGGKTDKLHGEPLVAEVTVKDLNDGVFHETEARHGGFTTFEQGRTAVVETDGGLTIMLTSRRSLPFSLNQFKYADLDPLKFKVLVAKGVNAPLAAYRPICPTIIRVNTPGVTTADMKQLTFHHRRKPMFPFEPETAWNGEATLK